MWSISCVVAHSLASSIKASFVCALANSDSAMYLFVVVQPASAHILAVHASLRFVALPGTFVKLSTVHSDPSNGTGAPVV